MAMAAVPEATPEARILVVDDETNIVELLSVSLKFQGFEVHSASNGPAALRARLRQLHSDHGMEDECSVTIHHTLH